MRYGYFGLPFPSAKIKLLDTVDARYLEKQHISLGRSLYSWSLSSLRLLLMNSRKIISSKPFDCSESFHIIPEHCCLFNDAMIHILARQRLISKITHYYDALSPSELSRLWRTKGEALTASPPTEHQNENVARRGSSVPPPLATPTERLIFFIFVLSSDYNIPVFFYILFPPVSSATLI